MPKETTAAPVRSRNPRGSGDLLRDQILEAVEQMAGDDYKLPKLALSLREIARKVGVAAPSIYRHFATKEEVIIAVIEMGFSELFDAENDAAQDLLDPFDRLSAMGRAYCEYLLGRPGLSRLMFAANPTRWDPDHDTPDYLARQLAMWTTVIDDCAAAGYDIQLPSDAIAKQVWAQLHGFVTLSLVSIQGPTDRADAMNDQIHLLLNRIRQLWSGERAFRDEPLTEG